MKIEARRQSLSESLKKVIEADQKRNAEYFQALLPETEMKLRQETYDKSKSELQVKLQTIRLQSRPHREDIVDRYKLRCEVELLDVVSHLVPRWRGNYDLKRRAVDPSCGVMTAWWDEQLKALL